MKKFFVTFAVATIIGAAALAPVPAHAYQAGHPRINEVDNRLVRQTQRTSAGVQQGTITKKEAVHDVGTDAKVATQMRVDEKENGGKITGAEQVQLNNELDGNGNRIYAQRH